MCTSIKMDYPGGSVLGRTMDLERPGPYNILYQPPQAKCADNLLGGTFSGKYRNLGVGFRNLFPLKDGINDQGLMGVANDYGGFGLFPKEVDPNKINVSSYHFLTYLLANYASVDEVIEALPHLHLPSRDFRGDKVITPDFHFMLADANQRCIIIEPEKKGLRYYENPYQVMTNAPRYPSQERHLKQVIDSLEDLDAFNGAKDLPGGYDPKDRFVKAFYLSQNSLEASDGQEALGYLYRCLSAVALPKGFIKNQRFDSITFTQYISGYDSQSRSLTLQAADNPTVYRVSFEDIPDPHQAQSLYIPESFTSHSLLK